ncbi:hypothetical protein FRB95_007097 [Tulasnella sp. JGI-2019a]|nr:hypothetical protein FRB95_007097 [Tulasnella sp. JGI-2019a]
MPAPRILLPSLILKPRLSYGSQKQASLVIQRSKSTSAPLPTGTFRPIHHPLRGGKGLSTPPVSSPEGSRSASALLTKAGNYAQRGLVTFMVGISVWGIYAIWDVHTQIMAKAQEVKWQAFYPETAILDDPSSQPVPVSSPTALTS